MKRSFAASAYLVAAGAMACAGLGVPQSAAAYTFQIFSVQYANPTNPCMGGYGINDRSEVVIYDCSNGGGIPYLWHKGRLTALPQHPLAGPVGGGALGGTFPLAISNSGQIAGYYYDDTNVEHGFTYTPGTRTTPAVWTTLDHPTPSNVTPGTTVFTYPRGISLRHGIALGIAAAYTLPTGYRSGTIEGADRSVIDTTPTDQWQDFDGGSDPVNGVYNSVVGASGAGSILTGINDHRVIVGRRDAPFNDSFIYFGGAHLRGTTVCRLFTSSNSNVPEPPGCSPRFVTFNYNGYRTHATAINRNGDIAGWFNDPNNNYFGQSFIRSGATEAIQIVNVTDPVTGAAYISTATGMNNLGQIVGDVYPTVASWNNAPALTGDGQTVFVATP